MNPPNELAKVWRRPGKTLGTFLLGFAIAGASLAESLPGELIEESRALVRATRYEEAFARIEEALEQSRRLGDRRREAEAMLAMSFALGDSGAWPRGFAWADDALTIYEEIGWKNEEGRVLCELARVLNVMVRRDRAREILDRAEVFYRNRNDRLGLARVDSQRSLVEVHDGRYEDAIRFGRRALEGLSSDDSEESLRLSLGALSALAYARQQLGHWEEALYDYEQLIEKAWLASDQRQINYAYCNRADIRWRLGEKRPAEEDLWNAIEGWERARSRIPGTGEQRAEFLAAQVAAYDRMIRFLVDTSRGAEAFDVAERFRARSFLEILDEETLRELGSRQPALWRQRETLLAELGRIRLSTDSNPSLPVQRQVDRLEGSIQALETQLLWQRRDPGSDPSRPPTLSEIQEILEPGEVLVAYWVAEHRTLAWSVGNDSIRLVQIPVSRKDLERHVQDYLRNLRSPRAAEDAALQQKELEHLDLGRKLYRWLIAPLPAKAHRAQRMILVPDGALHYLPFEALVRTCAPPAEETDGTIHGAYRNCQFLGLERPIAYSPSAGTLLRLRERHQERLRKTPEALRPGASDLLAFAPSFGPSLDQVDVPVDALRNALLDRSPLIHARDEVERIAGLFDHARLRLDRQATEQRLKEEAGRFRRLHLATHGLVSDDLPMSSGLLLAAGEGEDGLLQAHEVLGLDLSADLVTLSACRTGRGSLRRGEGIVGLSRSFLTVGASSVVVSLWDVDDRSTPRLMEAFYRRLANGFEPPEALLEARKELFEESTEAKLVFRTRPLSYAHPRFWASFVVIGGL